MGKVIAAYRRHPWHGQPLAQPIVAGWLNLSQTRLSDLENGPALQNLDRLIGIAEVLGIPQDALWFYLPGHSPSLTNTGVSRPDALLRRVADAASESGRFATVTAELGTHREVLDHARWELGRIAVEYVHAPLNTVVSDLVAARDALFALLEVPQRPGCAREMYFLGGTACLMLAHASQNAGDQKSALTQLRTAWTLADSADHDALRAWARGTSALIHEWTRHPELAISDAQQGHDYPSSPQSRIRLAAIEARAAARCGDHGHAQRAIDRMQAAQDEPGSADEVVELGGLLSFPEPKRAYYLGSTYGLLGQHDLAEHHARAAIQAYETGLPDDRSYGDEALAWLDVTNARLAAGDLDGATAAATPVLSLPPQRRIRQIDTAVARTRQLLLTSAGDRHAAPELRDRLTEYLDTSRGHASALPSSGDSAPR